MEKQTRQLRRQSAELEQANRKLEELSFLDGLTGIPNRRRFQAHLQDEWKRAQRQNTSIALIMSDIDFFKKYNDSLGHLMGDETLRQIAHVFNNHAQRPGDLAARYGGEEFAVILSNTDLPQAMQVAEAIRQSAEAQAIPHPQSTVSGVVTISLGVAAYVPPAETTTDDLIAVADQALYQAKQNGRNRVEAFFNP